MKILSIVKNNRYQLMMSMILIIVTITIHNFCAKTYEKNYQLNIIKREIKLHPYNSFHGKSFVTDTYPIFKDVVIVGDSYAHLISSNLGFDMTNYSCPGFTVAELKHVVEVASKSNKKTAVIFIGPNDFGRKTELKDFYDTLSSYVATLRSGGIKEIIITAYLHSKFTAAFEEKKESKYTVDEYDAKLKELADKYEFVYYFDISDMDKHLDKYQNDPTDNIHFNYDFAVDYINRLYKFILDMKKKEIKRLYG